MFTDPRGDDWLALSEDVLSSDEAARWVARPDCGATVTFSGLVRDHAEGRAGVTRLEYEAYDEMVQPRLADLAREARSRWPGLGRLVCWHRVGALAVGDTAVVVAVSSAHRDQAFDAARWCIDTIKSTMPIWKHETWATGSGWGTGADDIAEVAQR